MSTSVLIKLCLPGRIWDQAPAEISKQTNAALEKIRIDIAAIQSELVGQPYWKYEPAFTPGMQEYIEAVSFLEYLVSGELLSLEKANAQLQQNTSSSFSVSMKDWLLGIADLSGELMRLAVTAASKDPNRTKSIREFLRTLLNCSCTVLLRSGVSTAVNAFFCV
jgi:predicted translin family RNA/ssDNA-binding protein